MEYPQNTRKKKNPPERTHTTRRRHGTHGRDSSRGGFYLFRGSIEGTKAAVPYFILHFVIPMLVLSVVLFAILAIKNYAEAYKVSRMGRQNRHPNSIPKLFMAEEQSDEQFTQKQILKEETEAPFRQVRLFLYAGLTASAVIGAVFTGSKLAAYAAGIRNDEISDLLINMGTNIGGIIIIGVFWKNDLQSQKLRLQRIQKGGALAALKLRITGEDGQASLIKLSDLRRGRGLEKRVVIVAAPAEQLKESMASALKQRDSLVANDLLLVPLQIDGAGAEDYRVASYRADEAEGVVLDHIGSPVSLGEWGAVLKKELAVALSQQPEALRKGVTIIVKKNGKVGTRRFGVPLWETLVADVQSREDAGLDISNI